jgi:HK97 family phage major capsid protein
MQPMSKTAEAAPQEADAPRTRGEILDALGDFDGAIKALQEDGGEDLTDLTAEQLDELTDYVEARDILREQLASMPDPLAIKARIDDYADVKAQVKRPRLGGQTTAGTGTDVKAVENGESELDKFLVKGPFKSFGHFCHAVRSAGEQPGLTRDGVMGEWNQGIRQYDRAIKSMDDGDIKASGLSELTDAEGASFVPVQFSQAIWERTTAEQVNFLSMVDVTPVSGNTLVLRAWNDKNRTAGNMYGGATAYWRAEAGQMSSTKPSSRDLTLKLNDLYIFFYATDELLDDAVAIESELQKVASRVLVQEINDVIVNGGGVGKPLGVLGAACKITASDNGGTNTVTAAAIDKMYVRRAPGVECMWLINRDVEPQLASLNYNVANTGVNYLYVPAGGISARPYDTIKGKRVVETEHCQALGTEGDIVLWAPSEYKAIVKSSGIKSAVSMHLKFDYGETAFRWTFRMDGRPYWDAAMTPKRGTNTFSPIVTLASTRT